MMPQSSIVHLNITDFAAAIAIAKDRSLADVPFVVAKAGAARAIVLAVSNKAREEGIYSGLPLTHAQRMVKNLKVLSPDPRAYTIAHRSMEEIASTYTPTIQNDSGGHLYLDLAGTSSLFGPHIDCAIHIRNEINRRIGLTPSVAVAANKLVAKIATRAIRPAGIVGIRSGEEADFIAPQDALLLPGVGPAMAKILSVTGLREIGELAALQDHEALALFGKKGLVLRDSAKGIDCSKVSAGNLSQRKIRRTVDFSEPLLDQTAIQAALATTIEDVGLEMRQSKLEAGSVGINILYADGVQTACQEKCFRPLQFDTELVEAACKVLCRAATRRVRIRGLAVTLADLDAPSRQADLFTPEKLERIGRLQVAVDRSRLQFGPEAITLACSLFHA
ncbi:MAG: DNA polymerase [Sphaerochaetaceae bacterium]|jgi:DNA polymerase-4|nr:DNA polymerase [Sphaerochaetaceae bacterium]MDD4258970.1 DNA polymerase [Sphaerochaetaceae bacterium]MDD4762650.1 DNA polymerase [Sphaerochaetaceae bacterium]MDD4840879.1 DNA polymerase [Sphaerochaetaceae bacterium]